MEATCDICIDIKEFDIYVHVNSNISKISVDTTFIHIKELLNWNQIKILPNLIFMFM